jgi:hypothetical protein
MPFSSAQQLEVERIVNAASDHEREEFGNNARLTLHQTNRLMGRKILNRAESEAACCKEAKQNLV